MSKCRTPVAINTAKARLMSAKIGNAQATNIVAMEYRFGEKSVTSSIPSKPTRQFSEINGDDYTQFRVNNIRSTMPASSSLKQRMARMSRMFS